MTQAEGETKRRESLSGTPQSEERIEKESQGDDKSRDKTRKIKDRGSRTIEQNTSDKVERWKLTTPRSWFWK